MPPLKLQGKRILDLSLVDSTKQTLSLATDPWKGDRSMARFVVLVVVNRRTTPSSKHQDLKQKVPCSMDEAQSHTKLQTPICKIKGYYGGDSSSLSLKGTF